jgi:hypothetical protein
MALRLFRGALAVFSLCDHIDNQYGSLDGGSACTVVTTDVQGNKTNSVALSP